MKVSGRVCGIGRLLQVLEWLVGSGRQVSSETREKGRCPNEEFENRHERALFDCEPGAGRRLSQVVSLRFVALDAQTSFRVKEVMATNDVQS